MDERFTLIRERIADIKNEKELPEASQTCETGGEVFSAAPRFIFPYQ